MQQLASRKRMEPRIPKQELLDEVDALTPPDSKRGVLLDGGEAQCAVCGAQANGLHYNAQACRSCVAFFRRTIVWKHVYTCKHSNNCPVTQHDRCACRSCRLQACYMAGMTDSAVRPQREPTGAQIRRRPAARVKMHSESPEPSSSIPHLKPLLQNPFSDATNPDQLEFEQLICTYKDHLLFQRRSLTSSEDFLAELASGEPQYKQMEPEDVDRLASVELGGLIFWTEKLLDGAPLLPADRETLFKRYSVRKLSLDHFFIASRYPQYAHANLFMMANDKFINELNTGFETVNDSPMVRQAKFRLLRPTIDDSLNTVRRFISLNITEPDIVTLHQLLLFGASNNQFVSEDTRLLMQERRERAIRTLYHYYQRQHGSPIVRLGEVVLQLCEIVCLCDKHVKDFNVVQLFNCSGLDDKMWTQICYSGMCDDSNDGPQTLHLQISMSRRTS